MEWFRNGFNPNPVEGEARPAPPLVSPFSRHFSHRAKYQILHKYVSKSLGDIEKWLPFISKPGHSADITVRSMKLRLCLTSLAPSPDAALVPLTTSGVRTPCACFMSSLIGSSTRSSQTRLIRGLHKLGLWVQQSLEGSIIYNIYKRGIPPQQSDQMTITN